MSDPSSPDPQPGTQPTPPPYQQTPYEAQPLGYQSPIARYKPTSVMVLGIIGIVIGAYGSLCGPVQLLGAIVNASGALVPTAASSTTVPTTQAAIFAAAQPSTAMNVWNIVAAVANTFMSIALLAAGIGSVMLKPWARKLMIGYAAVAIAWALIALVMNLVIVVPEMNRQFVALNLPSASKTAAMAWIALVSLIGFIFPAFVLVYFRKRHVVDAFESATVY